MTAGEWTWISAALEERLGRPIVDTQKMVAFALHDGRQIAVQKDVEAARLWVEHDESAGWPPATIIRKYAAGEGRHSNLPPRLHHASSSSTCRKVLVVSVTGPHMLEGVLSWYGAIDSRPTRELVLSSGTADDRERGSAVSSDEESNASPPSSVEDEAVSELTLGQLIQQVGASVRLTNCVQRSQLRQMTLSAARAEPDALFQICMAVPSMGRKSINELRDIIAQAPFNTYPPAGVSVGAQASALVGSDMRSTVTDQMRRLFGGLRVEWLARSRGGSVRLVNGVSEPLFKDLTLGDLMVDWHDLTPKFYRLKNLGRKSVSELREICTVAATDLLAAGGVTREQVSDVMMMVADGAQVTAVKASDALSALEHLNVFDIEDLRSKNITDLKGIVHALSGLLDERARDVVSRRIGLGGQGEETLEEIAQGYVVTRERIRQIEAKALRKMCAAADQFPLREALMEEAREIWFRLGQDSGYVAHRDLATLPVPPEFRLGLKLANSTIPDILDSVATRWRAGWHQFDRSEVELDSICQNLNGSLAGLRLPRPMPSNLDAPSRMVVDLGLGMRLLDGYLLSPAGTIKSQTRTIYLHRIFNDPDFPIEILSLANRAAGFWNESAVSARYLSLVLSRHPHLFIEAAGDNWFAIGLPIRDEPAVYEEAVECRVLATDTADGPTMASVLQSLLGETGPLRLSTLMERAAPSLSGRWSISSVGPSLLMHKELFERYLPGVYGLKGQVPDSQSILDAPPTYLLNEEQARLFALGRRAGVAWGVFPMWTPAAEFALCGWALEGESDEVLNSLLATASIDLWPVGSGEKEFWKNHLACSASTFSFHFEPREQVGYALPALDRLLAACLEARSAEGFSWITANLVLNRTVGSHVAAGLMALMCSLEVLTCDGDHWQLPHRVGPKLDDMINLLSGQLHDHGSLSWRSDIGTALLTSAAQALNRSHSWLDRGLFAVMLDEADTADAAHDFQSQMIQAAIDELLWEEEGVASPALAEARNALEADYTAIKISAARVLGEKDADWSFGSLDDEEAL